MCYPFKNHGWLVLVLALTLSRESVFGDEATVDLNRQATSLLRRECVSCHGPDKQEANLRLDSPEFLWAGGDSGPVLERIPDTEQVSLDSMLLVRIEHKNEALMMPPKRPLATVDRALFRSWVESGAGWPSEPGPDIESGDPAARELGDAWSDPKNPIRVLYAGKRLDLWSLRPIQRPELPKVANPAWCRNAIDRFVLSHWESEKQVPAPIASEHSLARRVSIDMTGLPPTFEQMQGYLADDQPDKYDRWIEQMMLSPAFGVHWSRMWLDVVRYSDSNGFDWDEFRPNAWRYRDYVVRALNHDLPYDRFVEEQLAGDELLAGPPRNLQEQDCLVATGYLRLGPQDNAASLFNEQDRARNELLSDLTETTASAMLGLTMSCCRCHDHKTDPLSHADHYRLRAFFAASQYADDVSIDLQSEQLSIRKHNQRLDKRIKQHKDSISALIKEVMARQVETIDIEKAKELMSNEERDKVNQEESEVESLKAQKRSVTRGLLMQDKADAVPTVHVLAGGDHRTPKESVEPGFPSVLFPNAPDWSQPERLKSTGRRLTLARWIGSSKNPWAARVIVNRLWQNYFGAGIVETPNDFGVTGATPRYPELLDYLAVELIDSGWSLKHIHRMIVSSNVYRLQAQSVESSNPQGNHENVVSMRTQLRRMSAEQLRDSILHVSGLLQERAGGAPVWPVLDEQTLAANPAVLDDNATKTKGWYPSPESDQTVRSLYLIQKRTIRIPWLETFDLPENMVSCGRRECSLVAPQSLALMNGSLSLQAAQQIAKTTEDQARENRDDQITAVFRQILQREPVGDERSICSEFLDQRSLSELCLVLLNTNEFCFVE